MMIRADAIVIVTADGTASVTGGVTTTEGDETTAMTVIGGEAMSGGVIDSLAGLAAILCMPIA